MSPHEQQEQEFSFKSLLVPLTTSKAIFWIVAIGFIVYFNALFNGFVWDDKSYILNNPFMQTFNISSAFLPNVFNDVGQYRPLISLYFNILYVLFGATPFIFHLLQLAFHITNTILLYVFLSLFFKRYIAFILSLVFLIHPINGESVSFIGASDNVLFFFFGMFAFLLQVKYSSLRIDIVVSFFLLLSLLMKETGIVFLLLIILYRIFFHKRSVSRFVLLSIFLLSLYLIIRLGIGGISFATRPLAPIVQTPLGERLLMIPSLIMYYVHTFFFPNHLAIDQLWVINRFTFTTFYFPLILLLLVFICILFFRRNLIQNYKKEHTVFLFFISWFCIALGLHLQIFPLDMTVADRWFYLPMVGMLGIFGVLLTTGEKYLKQFRFFGLALLTLIMFSLSIRTIVRNTNWQDAITLFTHDVQYNDNFDLENNLYWEYSQAGRYHDAFIHAQKSVAYFAEEGSTTNLALAYEHLGNISKAKETFYVALHKGLYIPSKHKHYETLYSSLATLLVFYDDPKKAEAIIKQGLQDYPSSGKLWLLLALAQYKLNDHAGALNAATKAYQIIPNDQQAVLTYNRLSNNLPLYFSKK